MPPAPSGSVQPVVPSREPYRNHPTKGAGVSASNELNTYVILRRDGWRTPEDLQEAAARSRSVGDNEMSDDIRWIRSYVLGETAGGLGTVCIYQASSPEKVR